MSTPTSITFNNLSLQSSTYRTENITYRQLANKVIDSKPEPRRGGFDVIDTLYSQKEIKVTGWILSDSAAGLRTAVDSLKTSLLSEERNLDISYGSGVIRYVATVSSMSVPEEHYHITRLPFEITFLSLPWGTNTNSITDNKSITSSPYNNSINITGSYGPFPVLKWTVSGTPATAITAIKFENTTSESSIEVEGLNLDSNDKFLEVDVKEMTVKEGTTNVDFKGVFPLFLPGTNSYVVLMTGAGFTVSQSIVYFPTYL